MEITKIWRKWVGGTHVPGPARGWRQPPVLPVRDFEPQRNMKGTLVTGLPYPAVSRASGNRSPHSGLAWALGPFGGPPSLLCSSRIGYHRSSPVAPSVASLLPSLVSDPPPPLRHSPLLHCPRVCASNDPALAPIGCRYRPRRSSFRLRRKLPFQSLPRPAATSSTCARSSWRGTACNESQLVDWLVFLRIFFVLENLPLRSGHPAVSRALPFLGFVTLEIVDLQAGFIALTSYALPASSYSSQPSVISSLR